MAVVAGEVVGVREGAQRVLLAPDDVLQRDVGDVADVPDRRQVGEQVAGHDRLARLPLVLHVVRLTLHPERRRDLHEVDDLAVVLVRRAVDVELATSTTSMASRPPIHCFGPTFMRPVGLIEPWLTNRIQSLPLMSPMLFLPDQTTAYSGLLPGAGLSVALNLVMARFRASRAPGIRFWVTAGTSLVLLMASTRSLESLSADATEFDSE